MRQFFKFLFASCLGTFLALGLLFFLLISIGVASTVSTAPAVKGNSILELSFENPIPEQTNNTESASVSLDVKDILGLHEIKAQIDRAASDENIKGIYLNNTSTSLSPASARELQASIIKFKESGKFVLSYGDYFSQGSYYLASVADTIILNPVGSIDFKGFASFVPFFKNLLDKTGIKMQVYYAGQFKSATEPFRRTEMSPQSKLQTRQYLNDVYGGFLGDIAQARDLSTERLREIANEMLATNAQAALDLDLVDVVGYQDDGYAWMNRHLGNKGDKKPKLVSLNDYYLSDKSSSATTSNRIAVVYAQGSIVHSDVKYGAISDGNYVSTLARLRNTKSIKAVVLRVNSPGGSILASENILREVQKLQQAGKPVVVSMGDYAASGGYYISCSADIILAEEQTLTGSIGVFSMIPNVSDMLDDKLGINFDTVRTTESSAAFTPFFDWSDQEHNYLQQRTDEFYQIFLQKVATAREMQVSEVDEIAQGRIWTGTRALENGLVDRIGNLEDAIAAAAELANLDTYRTSPYPRVQDPLNRMIYELLGQDATVMVDRYVDSKLTRSIPHFKFFNDLLSADEPIARLPVLIQF